MNTHRLTHTESYHELLHCATTYAHQGQLQTKDLFYAAIELHRNHFLELLGVNQLIFPHLPRKYSCTDQLTVYTAEVDQVLSPFGGFLSEIVDSFGDNVTIDAFHVCAALLLKPCNIVRNFLKINGINFHGVRWAMKIHSAVTEYTAILQQYLCEQRFEQEIAYWKKVRAQLESICFGQQTAIHNVISQIAAFRARPLEEETSRPLVFCFFGETGTGKTLLAESIRNVVAELNGKPVSETLDLTRYSNEQVAIDLIGRDDSWRGGGKDGVLSSLAQVDPEGVLVLENVEAAHPNALNHLMSAISAGKIKDEHTGKTISLKQNIIILTTNYGAAFFNAGKFIQMIQTNGGTAPREKLIEGILGAFTKNALTTDNTLCALIKMCDYPILFSKHDCASTQHIILKSLDRALNRVEKTFHVKTEIDKESFSRFIIETLPQLGSAHSLHSLVEDIITTTLQNVYIDLGCIGGGCNVIRYQLDPIPDLKISTAPFDASIEAFQTRTDARLAAAKHLEFSTKVTVDQEVMTLHITNLAYKIMPTIEDADWFTVRPPNVTWKDLVGLEIPRQHAQRIIKHFRQGENTHLTPETGILLWGPPGTGKTSFAKAIASELNAPFIAICGADFQATHNDIRAIQRVHTLFNVARRNKAVIFIDELDALGSRETVTSTQASVINAFLAELDGVEEEKVLVIGATNRLECLDKALIRPGRIHHLVKIDTLKNAADRKKLIELIAQKAGKRLSSALCDFIVETTNGWAPANIQSILRETFYAAGNNPPSREHFIAARMAEFEGKTTQAPELSDEEKYAIAIHESGHVLLATYHHQKWIQVSLQGSINTLGFLELIQTSVVGKSAKQLKEQINIALAGHAAELVVGNAIEGSESDFKKATSYACRLIQSGLSKEGNLAIAPDEHAKFVDWEQLRPKVNEILKEHLTLTVKYLKKHKAELLSTAEKLMKNGVLFADELPISKPTLSSNLERKHS